MNTASWAIVGTVGVGVLAFLGKFNSDRMKASLEMRQQKVAAFNHFSTAFNRYLSLTNSMLKTGKKVEEYSSKVKKIHEVGQASQAALVALSKRPESGLDEILVELDRKELDKSVKLPSQLIKEMIAEKKRNPEGETDKYILFIDQQIRALEEIPITQKQIEEESKYLEIELKNCQTELDLAFGKMRLVCSSYSVKLAKKLEEELTEYLNHELTEKQIVERYEVFMGIANTELNHPLATKVKRLFKRQN